MKKSHKISLLIVALLILVLVAKFQSNYGFIVKYKEGSIVTYVFSFDKTTRHLDSLPNCYDESYFYDKGKDVTITKFSNKKKFLLDKVYIDYDNGNLCDFEYVLEEDFISKFVKDADVDTVEIEKCSKGKCKTSKSKRDISNLLNLVNKEKFTKENKYISLPENYKYVINVYYNMDNSANLLNIFVIDDNVIIKNIDENDHPKNIKYDLNKEIKKELDKYIK